jgi:hypothetical protein
MDTPSEPATRADHRIDWDAVEAHHHPVTLVSRPVYERWVLSLFGAILVGLIGLLGWAGYALSTVKAELRQVQASIAPTEPRSAGGEAVTEETAQRLREMDQRLHALESWTRDTAPRVTALEQRPREHVAKTPSPPPALPPATQLPRDATGAPANPAGSPGPPGHAATGRGDGALGRAGAGEFWHVAGVASGVGAPLAELSGPRPVVRVPVPHHL